MDKTIDKYSFNFSDKLGEGSYATVYKGKVNETKEIVAIKVLQKEVINQDEYLLEGLMQEIKIMQKLKSPKIV